MASYNPFGGAGNVFGGPTASWAERLGKHNPYTVGQSHAGDPYALREENEGRPALSYYAAQPGLTTPFTDWLTNPLTHTRLWNDYQGVASGRDQGYTFQDYLAEYDPRLTWMNQPAQQRGETPQFAYALPSRLNLQQ